MNSKGIDRRQFLKHAAVTCAAASAAGVWGYRYYSNEPVSKRKEKIFNFKNYKVEESSVYPKIAIVHGKDAERITRAAIDRMGGITRFVKPGERVLIKPNAGWDRQAEQAANTNPDVIQAVVRLCIEARASEVWVTDVSVNDPYRSFARSGIEAVVKKAGGKVKINTEHDFVLTDLKGDILKIWPVSIFYHQIDRFINIPVVKHHSLSKCTIAMKNLYGALGGQRNRLHQDINASIADLASAIQPTLTIVDATRVLKRNGPTGGSLSDVSIEDTVIAGTDMVAVESYSIRLLELNASELPYISIAENKGIGTSDWKSLNYSETSLG